MRCVQLQYWRYLKAASCNTGTAPEAALFYCVYFSVFSSMTLMPVNVETAAVGMVTCVVV